MLFQSGVFARRTSHRRREGWKRFSPSDGEILAIEVRARSGARQRLGSARRAPQLLDASERVDVGDGLVAPPSGDPWKAQGETRLVALAAGHAIESHLQHD